MTATPEGLRAVIAVIRWQDRTRRQVRRLARGLPSALLHSESAIYASAPEELVGNLCVPRDVVSPGRFGSLSEAPRSTVGRVCVDRASQVGRPSMRSGRRTRGASRPTSRDTRLTDPVGHLCVALPPAEVPVLTVRSAIYARAASPGQPLVCQGGRC